MRDHSLLGLWVRRFLLEYLVAERNLARNTQVSYRDTLTLLLPFVSRLAAVPIERLTVHDVSADRVRLFLDHIEQRAWLQRRHAQPATQRHSLAGSLRRDAFA
jgi:integrase/recombinase XerD